MRVKDLIKEIGADKAVDLGVWNDYTVLVATSDEMRCIGLPQYILLKNDKNSARWASPEETIELMNIFCV